VTALSVSDYIVNEVQTVTGRNGSETRALYSLIKKKGQGYTQDPYMLLPAFEGGDLYIRYWMKFQPDLVERMTPQTWRVFFEWKTAGDYRVIASVVTWGNVQPYWEIRGDNNANGGLPYEQFWKVENRSVAVPAGEWFKVEVFWHRSSGADGRVWMAINGRVILDRYGPNKGVNNASINRIMVNQLYTGGSYPVYQWVDEVEIWDGFPPDAGNRPYRPETGTPRSVRR